MERKGVGKVRQRLGLPGDDVSAEGVGAEGSCPKDLG